MIESLCEKAWCFFQEIVSKGGLCRCLRSGWLQGEIKRENDSEELCSFKNRERRMTGVNEFVLLQVLECQNTLWLNKQETRDIESWWSEWVFREDR